MSQDYIQAMRFWTQHQFFLSPPYEAENFHMPDAVYWMEKMREQDEAGEAETDLIKLPEVFKKHTNWNPWSENLLTYLQFKKGQNNQAPLAYVLREHDLPAPDMIFINDIDEII